MRTTKRKQIRVNVISLLSGSENITINVDGSIIEKSTYEKLFGVNVDFNLKFNEHLDSILREGARVNE